MIETNVFLSLSKYDFYSCLYFKKKEKTKEGKSESLKSVIILISENTRRKLFLICGKQNNALI